VISRFQPPFIKNVNDGYRRRYWPANDHGWRDLAEGGEGGGEEMGGQGKFRRN